MGGDELKKFELTQSDKKLTGIMTFVASVVCYNLWGDKVIGAGLDFIQSIFNY